MCSADTFLQLIEVSERDPDCMQFWQEQVHSAFVYAGNDPQSFQRLIRTLIGDDRAVISKTRRGVGDLTVSDHLDDFCGVMSGVRVTANEANTDGDFVLNTAKGNLINIISRGDGAVFWKLEYKGVPVFLLTSREIVDIDAELKSQNFDVREHFLSAVPLVLYIKWAFAETCWNAPEANACLVIDDPLLKPTHGFVDFQATSVSDETAQVFHQHRIHPMELEEKCSRNCSTVPRKPRAFLTFGSRLRSYPGGIR